MIFNSNAFLIFFAAALLGYWLVRRSARARNLFIFGASVFFYGWWDWRFVGLLLATGGLDFYVAQKIESSVEPKRRRGWLWLSLASNLGVLGFFKYAGFFVDSVVFGLGKLGAPISPHTVSIVLPAGISFYTFQALGYAIDVYRGQMRAERDVVRYFAFLTFFPQLVAGPIERASFLMTQFAEVRGVTRERVQHGVWLMLWGFFQKVVLADYLGPLVELAYAAPGVSGGVVLMGTLAFGGQIYCDFCGYSMIARGLASLFGFDLSPNFEQPYFSTSIQEFWRRWHQTLSTWFRDYVYIPLGGDRRSAGRTFLNVVVTFTLAGLWHGANWTFVFWGLWHGLALGVYRIWRGTRLSKTLTLPRPLAWMLTMAVVTVGWLFFRAASFGQLVGLIEAFGRSVGPVWEGVFLRAVGLGLAGVAGVDFLLRRWGWQEVGRWPMWRRGLVQGVLLAAVIARWGNAAPSFIYFQF